MVKALGLPRQTEVVLLTVIPEHVFLGGLTPARIRGHQRSRVAQMRQLQEERAMELLRSPAEELSTEGLNVERVVRRGQPTQEVLKACRRFGVDMAVLGCKGIGHAEDFALGSVAQKVLRYAPCSILLVRKETPPLERILVAVDGSKHSDEAVRFVAGLQLSHGKRAFLVSVVHSYASTIIGAPTLDFEESQAIHDELQKLEEKAARALVREAEVALSHKGYSVTGVVARGDPSQEILREAKRQGVQLIVTGAKGQTAVRRFLLGSVSQRVARYSECSILVVRPGGQPIRQR
jgi:nucleotide-binding universal stress UspA family protein